MRLTTPAQVLSVSLFFFATTGPVSPQTVKPHPLVMPLECSQEYCALLQGLPQTAGMRSGLVRLKPGETVGWHTTGDHEESLIILEGQGKALIEGQQGQPFVAPALVYIPPSTRHNVENTGKETLVYVYVVAPASKKQDGK